MGIRGLTSLTEAVVNGVNQLKNYPCRKLVSYYYDNILNNGFFVRRILCLTDGYNSSSIPYSTALDTARVRCSNTYVYNEFALIIKLLILH